MRSPILPVAAMLVLLASRAWADPPASQPANPLPGITVDKEHRKVTLECSVLHPGVLIELIACMPNSREHEAMVLVRARPQRIHLALLLVGFEPGHPAGWDEVRQEPIPATGDPLDLQIQWTDPKTGKVQTVAVEDWLAAADPAKPVPRLRWLFTGSRLFDDGTYMADQEGSIVSISNFPDAVIDLAGRHTRDNADLEFKSNAKVMPPAGTKCQLVILPPAALAVQLDRFGKVTVNGKAAPANKLPDLLAAHKKARDDASIELTIAPDAVPADIDKLVGECEKAGFRGRIERRRAPTSQPSSSLFPANDPLAAWALLSGQWGRQQATLRQTVAEQQRWLDQIRARRDLFARQYRELSVYVNQARQQYREAVAQLKS